LAQHYCLSFLWHWQYQAFTNHMGGFEMSVSVQDMIPSYVASRRGIVQKIAQLRAEQELIHHRLRLSLMESIHELPEWIHEEVEKYIAADEMTRRDFLTIIGDQLRYSNDSEVAMRMGEEVRKGNHREGQIRLDLTTWVSMRNSISFALDTMLKYTNVDMGVADAAEIHREARSYEKNRIKPIDYIEDLASPELTGIESIVSLLNEESTDDDDITISTIGFSRRQQEIMQLLIGEGKSYSQIAEELGISKDSVAEHVDQARKKAAKMKESRGIQNALREVMMAAEIVPTNELNKQPIAPNGKSVKEKFGEQVSIDDQ
jgi:predicted DNA-binding protein YlxM (UPF0122 family)